jgi:predicted transcriptional regulator
LAWYDDPLTLTLIVLVVIIACSAAILAMRLHSKKSEPNPKKKTAQSTALDLEYAPNTPFKVSKSIQTNTATNAKDELRMLDLEREILGDAIRRLYEAQAEGKITESERDKLAASYKMRMNSIKESITKDEGIIALHELEGMQEDLMKLFSERFGELTSKVEELRTRIDVKPIREIPIKLPPQTPTQMERADEDEEEDTEEPAEKPTGEEKPKKKRKPPEEKPTPKTEAERRIESIRSEVEKVLDKLGQMEIDS